MKKLILSIVALVMLLTVFTKSVSANTLHSLDENKLDTIKAARQIILGSATLDSYTWNNGVDGKVSDESGGKFFQLKTLSKTSGYVYYNPLTLYFKNVCSVGGRAVNATLNVDKIEYFAPYQSINVSDYKTMFFLTGYVFWANNDGTEGRAGQNLTLSTTFTWADTGEKVNIPLYQIVSDMDVDVSSLVGNESLNEGWKGISGYNGDIFAFTKYDYLNIDVDNMTVQAKKGTSSFDDDDSLLKGGVIVPCGSATKQVLIDTWAGTSLEFYAMSVKEPSKTADNIGYYGEEMYDNGDTVTWTVSQVLHEWKANTFATYENMQIVDTLPKEVEYQSAELYHGNKDVTSEYGTLTYDKASHTVKYVLNSNTLNKESFYDGGTLKLVITTKAVNAGDEIITATNNAYTITSNIKQDVSKTIKINNDIKLTVDKEWKDGDNADGLRPDNINVKLVRDMYLGSSKLDTEEIGTYQLKSPDWEKTTTVRNPVPKNLSGPQYTYIYRWEEISVPNGYTSSQKTEDAVTTITNTHTPKYKITTKIDNGIITDTEQDIPYGENRTITWTPGAGRYIESVKIDGKEIPVTDNYSFTNITADHEVVVTTLPYHKITTEIDHGTISDDIENIKNGENKNVSWVPGTGRYVSKVIINDKVFYEGSAVSGYPTSHEFSDIDADYDIKVETKLIPNLIITKEADKDVYNVDDVITYNITAEQTIKEAVATNVVIKDRDKTKGLSFDLDTITCSDKTAEITKDKGTFTVSLDKLAYGSTVKITVKGKVLKDELQSSDIKNIASIKSDQTEERETDKNVRINYNIVTAVENGTIDDSVFDLKNGDDKTINYQPDEGYYLDEIKVDGKNVDIETFGNNYDFKNVKDNHLIEVKYAPYYKVTGQIDYGTISDDKTDIKAGENHTVTWTPGNGRYITKVIINGKVFYEGNQTSGYPTEYEFTDIQRDYEVTVETATIPVETTTEETTTLEETTTEEQGKIGTPISTYKETTTAGEVVSNAPAPVPEANNVQNYTAPQTGGNAYNIFSIMCLIVLIPSIIIITLTKKNIINKKISNKKQR